MRRYGNSPQRGRTYGRRPGAYGILLRGADLLVTFQAEPDAEYQLPGGGIEPGEHPIAALHRETREETGWSIARPRHVGVWKRFTYMPDYDRWAEKICHVFTARPVRRLGQPSEPGHSALFLPARMALEVLSVPAEADFLARILKNRV